MKRMMLLIIFLACAVHVFAEETIVPPALDLTALSEKSASMEKNIHKIADEVSRQNRELLELRKEIDALKESNQKLTQVLRNLEIYVKSVSSMPPDASQWEKVRSGMKSEEIEKMLGQPEEIAEVRRVGTIWYYYGMGSITFNESGTVTDKKTFKRYPNNP